MTALGPSTPLSKSSALAFLVWALLHIAGSAYILAQLVLGGPSAGYSVYAGSELPDDAMAGAALGYMSYLIAAIGIAVAGVAVRLNWRNSEMGLVVNTGLVLFTEIGLVVFLLLPGHVTLTESLPDMVLFVAGATLGGIACQTGGANDV